MFHKIREAQQGEREEGFTLIELLVVVIIIGILAAIAIPVFLNQRTKARNSAANSDMRNLITAEEAAYTDNDAYSNSPQELRDGGFSESNGVIACVAVNTNDTFDAWSAHTDGSVYFTYNTANGTIVKNTTMPATVTCPTGTTANGGTWTPVSDGNPATTP